MFTMHEHSYAETLLTVNNVSRRIGDNLILRDINIDIRNITRPGVSQGQIVAILGPSGVGKTQFFRVLSGLEKPTTGEVLIGNEQKHVRVGQVGVVFQNYPIDQHLTVIQTLVRAGKQTGLSKNAAQEKGLSFLNDFGLVERKNFYPEQLSGGQRQRVAIIEQLMCSEHFLLMVEPFSGLDYAAKQDACALINKVVYDDKAGTEKEKNTIIVVTHDIDTALCIADKIWFMGRDRDEEGKIIPGARIIETSDLVSEGIAWRPDVQYTDRFIEIEKAIKKRFCDPKGPYTK
jgi:NitT/TauT family transport system ATP-binding protein